MKGLEGRRCSYLSHFPWEPRGRLPANLISSSEFSSGRKTQALICASIQGRPSSRLPGGKSLAQLGQCSYEERRHAQNSRKTFLQRSGLPRMVSTLSTFRNQPAFWSCLRCLLHPLLNDSLSPFEAFTRKSGKFRCLESRSRKHRHGAAGENADEIRRRATAPRCLHEHSSRPRARTAAGASAGGTAASTPAAGSTTAAAIARNHRHRRPDGE